MTRLERTTVAVWTTAIRDIIGAVLLMVVVQCASGVGDPPGDDGDPAIRDAAAHFSGGDLPDSVLAQTLRHVGRSWACLPVDRYSGLDLFNIKAHSFYETDGRLCHLARAGQVCKRWHHLLKDATIALESKSSCGKCYAKGGPAGVPAAALVGAPVIYIAYVTEKRVSS